MIILSIYDFSNLNYVIIEKNNAHRLTSMLSMRFKGDDKFILLQIFTATANVQERIPKSRSCHHGSIEQVLWSTINLS